MGTPFLAELRIFSFNFPPKGWALCNGQLLPIAQNQALFSILGTTYGGDGRVNFALPDLRGRTPVYVGDGLTLGQKAGEESHTLVLNEMPAHMHLGIGSAAGGDQNSPAGNLLGSGNPSTFQSYQTTPANLVPLVGTTIGGTGGGQAHANMQPYLTLNICIALQGIFPSRN